MIGRWHGLLLGGVVFAFAQGALGCAPAQPKIKRDLETMQHESTPVRLASRGDAFAVLGDMTRAEQYFVAAIHAGSDNRELTRKLIIVCVADARYPAALEYAEEYLRKHPGASDIRFAAATIRRAVGDSKGARTDLKQVLEVRSDFGDAHYALAQLEREEGNAMAADSEFRAYLRIEPNGVHAEEARENLMRAVR